MIVPQLAGNLFLRLLLLKFLSKGIKKQGNCGLVYESIYNW